jgi:hypothetical protein
VDGSQPGGWNRLKGFGASSGMGISPGICSFYGNGEKYKNSHGQMIEELLQAGHRDRGFA